jgi:hypothetical protein
MNVEIKFHRSLKFYVFSWAIDILLFLLILITPKNETLYQIFYYLFIASILVFPLGLGLLGVWSMAKEEKPIWKASMFPISSSILIALTSFIYFTRSLIEEKRPFMMGLGLVCITLMALFTVGIQLKKIPNIVKIVLSVLTLATYFIFLYIAMKLSYEYSILW